MNFCTDRDLLTAEPTVFADVPVLSQQRLRVNDGQLTGVSLTSASANFVTAGITVGHVVMVATTPMEVLERVDANTLTVSQLRARLTHDPIPGTDGANLELIIRSFEPQITLVHDSLMQLLEQARPKEKGATLLNESGVVSVAAMARLEMHGALERIYSGALALAGDNGPLAEKASHHRTEFRRLLGHSAIDLRDPAGGENRRVYPGVSRLIRA